MRDTWTTVERVDDTHVRLRSHFGVGRPMDRGEYDRVRMLRRYLPPWSAVMSSPLDAA